MSVALGILYHEFRRQGEPFGLETLHFRQLCEMGQVRGMSVYVFTPDGWARDESKIQGYAPDDHGRWLPQFFPLPDVIYQRGVTMDLVSDQRMSLLTAELQDRGVHLLNSIEFSRALGDKWLTYQLLATNPTIRAHLPQTALLTEDVLMSMLTRYPIVMVKHRFGFESRGMIRIASIAEGGYSCVINDLDARRQRITFPGAEALASALPRFVGQSDDFIIQQGIRLADFRGRNFELRVILNKTEGRWLRTGMVVRLSGATDMPFLAVGNERNQRPSEILPLAFGLRSSQVLEQVRSLSRIIVAELEQKAGSGGEAALDFGFDEAGHPWLIEGNSRPFNLFIRTGAFSLRRKNMARVLEYAQQLATNVGGEAGVHH